MATYYYVIQPPQRRGMQQVPGAVAQKVDVSLAKPLPYDIPVRPEIDEHVLVDEYPHKIVNIVWAQTPLLVIALDPTLHIANA